MKINIYQVDAFTDQPFRGNPAAVCILPDQDEKFTDSWMASVAREMNLSETAFLRQVEDGFNLRWFTPTVEVDLCGHATLASAHILYTLDLIPPGSTIRFHTKSGLLTAKKQADEIELDFPATPPGPIGADPRLADALGVAPLELGKSQYDYLVCVGSEAEVRNARPDFVKLGKLGVRGVMLTSQGETGEFDFISRFFAPGAGIDEDPVTGSAHCCLGPYWSAILGKAEMLAYQASARGGAVRVRVGQERVYLGGKAVLVMAGELLA
jgi:PhzF family phenazine biosynthesis protein